MSFLNDIIIIGNKVEFRSQLDFFKLAPKFNKDVH